MISDNGIPKKIYNEYCERHQSLCLSEYNSLSCAGCAGLNLYVASSSYTQPALFTCLAGLRFMWGSSSPLHDEQLHKLSNWVYMCRCLMASRWLNTILYTQVLECNKQSAFTTQTWVHCVSTFKAMISYEEK